MTKPIPRPAAVAGRLNALGEEPAGRVGVGSVLGPADRRRSPQTAGRDGSCCGTMLGEMHADGIVGSFAG